ncbi:MAG TPA: HD domain-containing protein [Planktothrix sp.]
MSTSTDQISIPDSKLAREIAELARAELTPLLFNHSSRVYHFASLSGKRKGLKCDHELLYAGAMFHDFGLMPKYSSKSDRFEVDGANASREFLKQHGINEQEITDVWTAIALHTTPGVPQYMKPTIALVTAGVEMDVLGIDYDSCSNAEREQITSQFPRSENFKEDIINAFYNGIKHKPESTFGNVKADVIADKEHSFKRMNFCQIIRDSSWGS